MATYSNIWSAFSGGELSPLLDGRVDLPQYMKGGATMLNWIPTPQGPMQRRGGVRFIADAQTITQPSLLIRFSRSLTQSYIIEFANGILRFFFNGGLVLNGGSAYTVASPYTQSDLFNADGSPGLCVVESVDQLYIASPNHPPYVLSYFAPTNWTLAPLAYFDGPWNDGNQDQTAKMHITGSVTVGSTITITCTNSVFQAGHVGALIRLHQQDLSQIKPWAPGQQNSVIGVGTQRRSGFCTYQCTNNSSGAAPSGGTTLLFVQTGGNTLTHTSGLAWDGDQSTQIDPIGSATYYSTGMQWSYQDCGYGVAKIISQTGTTANAVVTRQFPAALVGTANPTYLWELGAWNGVDGYPSQCTFYKQRLVFSGGARIWMSVSGDFANFADLQFGQVLTDSALTALILSDQFNQIAWLSPQKELIIGTTGGEFVMSQQSVSDPFGPTNFQIEPQSNFGGRTIPPVRVQTYTLFVQQNGTSFREFSYDFASDAYKSIDETVISEHIPRDGKGIVGLAWAKNPNMVVWLAMANGSLASYTYNPEQEVRAWARHDIAGGRKVICMAVVPSATGIVDDVYLMVQRTVNGSTDYSIEKIEQAFANLPGDAMQDMFYVDGGFTFANTINATLTPGTGATVQGTTGVVFTAGSSTFASTDVNRFIDFDWQTTIEGPDGLPQAQATKGRAQITNYTDSTHVNATIIAAFPNTNLIAANTWRMTVTTLSGISSVLEAGTVSMLLDGATAPDITYSGGNITLPYPASVVQLGLKSPAVWKSMRPEGGDPTGSAMGKKRKVNRFSIRVLNTLGLSVGPDINTLMNIETRPPNWPNDQPPPLLTGNTARDNFNGEIDTNGQVMVVCDQPLPCTVCAIAVMIGEEPDN